MIIRSNDHTFKPVETKFISEELKQGTHELSINGSSGAYPQENFFMTMPFRSLEYCKLFWGLKPPAPPGT